MKRLTLGLGITLILAALATSTTTTYLNSSSRTESIVYSNKAMLAQLWETSKANQVEVGSGRTVDRSNHNVTTSEGESYTLLRSVWMDDQKTFDSSIKWTQGNLQRPSDLLYSSRYGRRPDGSYGILTDQGGVNTSAGADTDIALALVMASQRWHDQKYLDYATPIIKSIWNQ
jgi:endo-1,4-beta-D-glucanase Y